MLPCLILNLNLITENDLAIFLLKINNIKFRKVILIYFNIAELVLLLQLKFKFKIELTFYPSCYLTFKSFPLQIFGTLECDNLIGNIYKKSVL